MSHSYKITTPQRTTIESIIIDLRENKKMAFYIGSHPTYLVYEDGGSTRGVEVAEVEDGYELKMFTLANSHDYLLCNAIAFFLCTQLEGVLTDETGKEKNIGKLFYDRDISDRIDSEIQSTVGVLSMEEKMTIVGPVRDFCFGPVIYKKILSLEGDRDAIASQFSKMLQASQFPPKNFAAFSNISQVVNNKGELCLAQVIANSRDMVIESVEKIILSLPGDTEIMLSPEEMIRIIPDQWILLDEYTILAQQLAEADWQTLGAKAKQIRQLADN